MTNLLSPAALKGQGQTELSPWSREGVEDIQKEILLISAGAKETLYLFSKQTKVTQPFCLRFIKMTALTISSVIFRRRSSLLN